MQYARLGDTGHVISRMGFGAMTFGEAEMVPGVKNQVGQTLADEMVGRCLDAGITLFDTADAYVGGETERMLGKALGARRRDVAISTKVGFRTGAANQRVYVELVRAAPVERRQCAAENVVATFENRRPLERPKIGDTLHDADGRPVARFLGADGAGLDRVQVAADAAPPDRLSGRCQGLRQRLQQAGPPLDQVQRRASRRAGPEPGESREELD